MTCLVSGMTEMTNVDETDNAFTEAVLNRKQIDLQAIFDLPKRSIWPSTETHNIETECCQDFGLIEEAPLAFNDEWLYFAIQQIWPLNQNISGSNLCVPDDEDSHNLYLFPTDVQDIVPPNWPVLFPGELQKRLPITLVLDLDETLVHSTWDTCKDADFSFPVHFSMQDHTVYVRLRPYLQMFLEAVANMFEIIIFTAGQSIYAERLLDVLDPDHTLIGHRIYRDSCVFSESGYVKDLTILGRDLARIAIVDNSPQVFQLQVENGIPIESWFGDPSDDALVSLLSFLETLVGADDVRPIIKRKFGVLE